MAVTHLGDEPVRLATLREYQILDTEPEEAYDELVKLAAFVCTAPMAVMSLIDEGRQWFKARLNLDAVELPRELSFCEQTIFADDALLVPDARADARFATSPFVTGDPHIRFYAGVPLRMRNGQAIGALAVMGPEPYELTSDQHAPLTPIGRQVVAQLELRRHLAEQQRLQREGVERFQLLARATNDAVYDWNFATNEIWWNEGVRTLWGIHPDDIATIHAWGAHIHPDDRKRVETTLYGVIQSGRRYWTDEYRFLCSDGRYADILDRGYVIHDDGKPVRMIGAMLDITERRRLEVQLRQSQKMEAIGQLSGGVAQDFNNLLTVIQVNASLIARAKSLGAVKEHADDIVAASDRAAALTRQLLMVSRKQVMQPTVVDVNDVVRNILRILERALGEHITLAAHCSTELPLVKADVGLLEQVLLNLALNARDAMPSGGHLTIATGEKNVVDGQALRGFDVRPGPHVFVSVTDTGVGIDPDVLPHIFEPFFTTKDVGKGSGLGLATVYGIIRQHHGWIDVASTSGGGTTFCFYLPATAERLATASVHTADDAELPGGSETILVVEDEDALRALVVGLLAKCGYRVLAARSGVDALAQWPQLRGTVQLLVTDIVMPGGINGRELAARMRVDDPDLCVVYTSGYSAAQVGSAEPLVEGDNFLHKPFQPNQLARIVRDVLDRGNNRPG
jgi:PAS domain S-box-containing protein